jgi:hypothetical protein
MKAFSSFVLAPALVVGITMERLHRPGLFRDEQLADDEVDDVDRYVAHLQGRPRLLGGGPSSVLGAHGGPSSTFGSELARPNPWDHALAVADARLAAGVQEVRLTEEWMGHGAREASHVLSDPMRFDGHRRRAESSMVQSSTVYSGESGGGYGYGGPGSAYGMLRGIASVDDYSDDEALASSSAASASYTRARPAAHRAGFVGGMSLFDDDGAAGYPAARAGRWAVSADGDGDYRSQPGILRWQ